ncbi:amino acid/amide ABC transporter substrate-binding protein (HAAT family) [Pseudonocardia sediminis]|uniref:Amino acid/amide ABC transporter substrate-binding protein (HAAT family) n=1 Tax=Pseudonocardia sediminis TaxID=1397368 RepID=A0A4Q7V5R3_PSEST|nr:amino acid/amide ABC transporter substrate-binding protein (HAAT family) [Pseudonocardia sediminis]
MLSLTGPLSRFGTQAADGLRVGMDLLGAPAPVLVDDAGEPGRVAPTLDVLAGSCDLLLGPYGTSTARAAARWARESGRFVWNHGGAGDRVQGAAPGRVVSVLTPTSGYAGAFVRYLAREHPGTPLRLVPGRGGFGRQVVAGAREAAARAGVTVVDEGPGALFLAGSFDEDVDAVNRLPTGADRPVVVGTVAAGVREFGRAAHDPDGVFGVAQWVPGAPGTPEVGPDEATFLDRYRAATGTGPDYPAVQAAATAAIALHCASVAGSTDPGALWAAATALRTTTLYGAFAIDPVTGTQTGHGTTLVRWRDGRMSPV